MASRSRQVQEMVFLILQFLQEEKFNEAAHRLEQESGVYFNVKYFEEKVLAGEWDEVEKYMSGYTKIDDNMHSRKIFFEIRKIKYLEALDRKDRPKAVEILVNDLKVFSTFNENVYNELTQLLMLSNFRESEKLSRYGDTNKARSRTLDILKRVIEANPLFRNKLVFPTLKPPSRLKALLMQSVNWQHQQCKNPSPKPTWMTLFEDHICTPPNGIIVPTLVNLPPRVPTPANFPPCVPMPVNLPPRVPTLVNLPPRVPTPVNLPPLGSHGHDVLLQPSPLTANANAASSSVQAGVVSAASLASLPNQVSLSKRPATPLATLGMSKSQSVDLTKKKKKKKKKMSQNVDHEQVIKRLRPAEPVKEVSFPTAQQVSWSVEDLPRTVAFRMHQGSTVTSMDFHPSHQTLLLVGSINGEITLWEVGSHEKLASKSFKIWDISTCSSSFQASFVKSVPISVNRVRWSPDGQIIGAAFNKHLIHLYAYAAPNNLLKKLEIDAHVGGVNDLAFAHPNKHPCVITCGDDKLIKVWDLTGRKLFNFEGHEAPVYSVLPQQQENTQFIFSTAMDGKIKAWFYDNMGTRVDYTAPGHGCTTMLYSADGSRLFSCGTSKEGDSFLVEWKKSNGTLKKSYAGLTKTLSGVAQFDTTKNHFLAVGEENQIKFWDMDSINILTSTDADGGLPIFPCLRFNKEGNLLAVATANNGIKILANAVGLRSLKTSASCSMDQTQMSSSSAIVNANSINCVAEKSSPVRTLNLFDGVDSQSLEKPRDLNDATNKMKPEQFTELTDFAQCRLVTMLDNEDAGCVVSRLLYTNSGDGIVALVSNGAQRLWKWACNEQHPTGKATASVTPHQWLPKDGGSMVNDSTCLHLEESVPCIALTNDDTYVMSATCGMISLFDMVTFELLFEFLLPSASSTFLAFHPQDNDIVAIGMEDSKIHIYNTKRREVKSELRGHQKRITGLAFSIHLKILVSSSADAHICFWSLDSWEKRKIVQIQQPLYAGDTGVVLHSDLLQLPHVESSYAGDTRVQFHSDQIRLLISNETRLATYDASKMEHIHQWVPQDTLSGSISSASYSCNGQLVYASFFDGNIGVFDADGLKLRCRIAPAVYLLPSISLGKEIPCPLMVATHPQKQNQFAVGLTDGSVMVIEPFESEGKWFVDPL